MNAITTTATTSNSEPQKTLAKQLDRLDGILDGLDAALAGAVQKAVEQAVKQAVQAVLTEVLNIRQLQEQMEQATQLAPPSMEMRGKQSIADRLWRATTESARRTVQKVKKFGRGVALALMAASGVLASTLYAARKQIASVANSVSQGGGRLLSRTMTALISKLPSFTLGGT
jgi:hypothetical protein